MVCKLQGFKKIVRFVRYKLWSVYSFLNELEYKNLQNKFASVMLGLPGDNSVRDPDEIFHTVLNGFSLLFVFNPPSA